MAVTDTIQATGGREHADRPEVAREQYFAGLAEKEKQFIAGAVLYAGIILIGNVAITLFGSDLRGKAIFSDITSAISSLLAAGALFYAARRSSIHSRQLYRAWLILALAQLCYALGDVFWAILEIGLEQPPFPSIADIFYLVFYPLFLSGVLWLPRKQFKRFGRLKSILDMSLIMLAALLVTWNFLLGPLMMEGQAEAPLVQVLSLAYPVGDLALLVSILIIWYRRSEAQPQSPLLLLSLSLLAMIVTDYIFSYQSLLGTYQSGGLIDLGWVLSILLIGLAGVWQAINVHPTSSQRPMEIKPWPVSEKIVDWTMYLPYAWLAGAYLLLIESHFVSLPMSFSMIAAGVGILIALTLLRQLLTLSENQNLYEKLQKAVARAQHQTNQLSLTNHELEIEIDERRKAETRLAYDALHDSLTGLPNRALFIERLQHAIEYTQRREGYHFSVLFLDLDHFKVINDSLGHHIGDQLLIAFAQRLKNGMRLSDTVARLGGDEFVILLENTKNEADVLRTADRLQEETRGAFSLEGRQVFTTASTGIVLEAHTYNRPEEILRDADIAMYRAKSLGKARYEIFQDSFRESAIVRLELENELRLALERNEFELFYQPILSLETNQITGIEALIRWRHPVRGLIFPKDFISVAEETGLIIPIGRWVLSEGCHQISAWHKAFPQMASLQININISGIQISQPDFASQVEQVLAETGLEAKCLSLEITESVCLTNSEIIKKAFLRLSELGVQFHIDDFGMGYSSLNYLQQYPIHTIKIDRAFVGKMDASLSNSDIVRSIITLAHDLNMEAVAEGVETEAQLLELRKFGCNYGQGFLLSHPKERADIEKLLVEQSSLP